MVGQMAQAKNSVMTASVGLNVCSGPGLNHSVIGSLARGETVTVTGPSAGGWAPVRFQGRRAYVAAQYLSGVRGTTAVAASGSSSAARTVADLNVRTGAGTDNPVVTTLPRGTRMTLTGRTQGDWSQISLKGRPLWVNNAWIAGGPAATSPVSSATVTSRARATTALMIRSSARSDFRSLGTIASGSLLDLTGVKKNGVTQILWQGHLRWVNSSFLTPVAGTSGAPTPKVPGTIGSRWTTTKLAIRPASVGPRYLYEVPAGTRLEVTGRVRNGRAEVVVSGASRWVTAMYLTSRGSTGLSRTAYSTGGDLDTGGSSGLNSLTSTAKGIVGFTRTRYPQVHTMYGVRPDPLPDHPSGHGVDLMIPNYRSNRALGTQIANDLQANAGRLGVKYIIWRQHIWSPARASEGWRPMADRGGDTANHYDHVHVTVH